MICILTLDQQQNAGMVGIATHSTTAGHARGMAELVYGIRSCTIGGKRLLEINWCVRTTAGNRGRVAHP